MAKKVKNIIDINNDGVTDVKDLKLIQEAALKKKPLTTTKLINGVKIKHSTIINRRRG
jgi:hypothetical protein